MELWTSRWAVAKVALVCGVFLAAIVANLLDGFPAPMVITAVLAAGLGPAVLAYQLPTRVIARVDASTLYMGDKTARLADLIKVETRTARVNLIPVSRMLIFTFQARANDSWAVRVSGTRKFHLSYGRVAGGRTAIEQFAALAVATRDSLPPQRPRHDPVPSPADAQETAAFDADAIIARYLIEKARSAPAEARAQRGFGRKGL